MVLDRRFRLGHGKVFALYVALYSAGRFWIEALRIDTVNEIGGFRLNNYTALIAFVVAAGAVLVWLVRNRPGREAVVEAPPAGRRGRRRPGRRAAGPATGRHRGTDDAGRADPRILPTPTGPTRAPAPAPRDATAAAEPAVSTGARGFASGRPGLTTLGPTVDATASRPSPPVCSAPHHRPRREDASSSSRSQRLRAGTAPPVGRSDRSCRAPSSGGRPAQLVRAAGGEQSALAFPPLGQCRPQKSL